MPIPEPLLEHVLRSLRIDLPGIVLGLMMLVVGVAACLFSRRQRQGEEPLDRPAFWFGIFSALYGLRLLVENGTFPAVAGVPAFAARWATVAITYIVPVPGMLFLANIFPDWSPILRRVVRLQCGLALLELGIDIFAGRPGLMLPLNNLVVLFGFAAFLTALWRTRASSGYARSVGVGLGLFVASAVIANLAGIGRFRLPIDIEKFGFAAFLVVLGRLVIQRSLESSKRLAVIDDELQMARRIQLSILPRGVPENRRFRIAAAYQPMNEVGGDFYDFVQNGDSGIGVLIADVSGHGMPAALIASMVKVAFASQRAHASDPAKVLEGVNEALSGLAKGQFVTAGYLYLDFAANKVRYSAAGHPPALRWTAAEAATASLEPMQQKGFALGLTRGARYRTQESELRPLDCFLLYTDGLIEAHNQSGEEFGLDRVREAVAKVATAPGELLEGVLGAVRRWAGDQAGARPCEDDLTAVAIKVESV